ncbi:hypothetical protein D6C93_02412 [Aureobasidium pullulans]|nr:hypothetical protein D6C93_02412 [Aureobasidium pullulans]
MPTLPRPGKQSLFDMVEQNKATAAQAHADNEAISSTQHEDQYTTSQKQLDPERLGSKEEAIRQGGAQPAGYRGVGGGYAAGGPWTGGM